MVLMTARTRPTREQTRARVLQAAGEVFTALGYEHASLDQVAAAAGLTKGAVYSSFSSKDELFGALVADRLDQRLSVVSDRAGDGRDLSELLADAEDDLSALFSTQRDWHLLFIEAWARAVRDPERRAQWATQRRATRDVIAEFFERHAASTGDQLPIPASELALTSMALANGLAMEHIADPENADPALFARTLSRLLHP